MKDLYKGLVTVCGIMFVVLSMISIVLWAKWDFGAGVDSDTLAHVTAWAILFLIGMIVSLVRYKSAEYD